MVPFGQGIATGDQQVALHEADWLVTAGHVDCFALEHQAQGEAGRRRPLFTVPQGGVLLRVMPEPGRPALVAVLSLGARLEPLKDAVRTDQRDAWAQRLLRACVEAPSASLDRADAAGEHSLMRGDRIGFGREATLLQVDAGTLLLGGVVEWRHTDGPLLAIEPLWVEAVDQARVSVSQPRDAGDGLAGLHRFALSATDHLLEARARSETERLQFKSERESGALQDSLQLLVKAAGGRIAAVFSNSGGDPVAAAVLPVVTALAMRRQTVAASATVEEVVAAHGLRHRRVLLRPGWRQSAMDPIVGFLGEAKTPVALLPRRRGWRMVGAGVDVPLDDAIEADLQLDAVQVYRALPTGANSFATMLQLGVKGSSRDLVRAGFTALVTALTALALPLALGTIFDTLLPTADRAGLWTMIGLLVVATVASGGFAVANALALLRIETRFEVNSSPALMDRLLRLPARFFRDYTVGDLVDRLLGIQRARLLVSNNFSLLLSGTVVAVASLLLLLSFSLLIAASTALLTGTMVAATLTISWRQRRLTASNLREGGRLEGLMLQLITGITKLRGAAAEGRAMTAWAVRYATIADRAARVRRLAALQHLVDGTFPVVAVAMLYLVIVRVGGLTTGDVVAIVAAFAQTLAALMLLARAASDVAQAEPLVERARPLLETPTETAEDAEPVGRLEGAIGLRGVTFGYAADIPLVVDDVSLDIPTGSMVAFVGPSGSGKSTILRLLLGFERPMRGEVLFDGRAAERLDPVGLRRQIGVVLQNGRIFSGSILQNILGPARLDISEVWAAARMVGLERDIEDMPMGMHTVLLDGGSAISGGQRQRILIARALIHRPRILLFDEATSALDNRTQAIVTETLARMSITRVVIAHRLTTIEDVDRIFVMERGRLVQQGTYRELLDTPGLFRELAKRQMLGLEHA